MKSLRALLFTLACLLTCPAYLLAAEFSLTLADDTELPIQHYPASGDTLVIWLPSEFGISPRLAGTAQALTEMGVEVWLPDLHTGWFVPPGRYSLVDVPPEVVMELIEQAGSGGKQVVLLAPGRMAVQTLRGIRLWQGSEDKQARLVGAILLHPKLYARTPQGGESSEFLPIAGATNAPLYLMQPVNSAYFWRLATLREQLERGGAPVYAQVIERASDGFNARTETRPGEPQATARLPGWIVNAVRLLSQNPVPDQPASLASDDQGFQVEPRKELLRELDQPLAAPALRTVDLAGRKIQLKDHAGQVVLVNFWATWCPPCVKEIPSLERLQTRLAERGFQVMAVDVGEQLEQVQAFLADKPVRFPVLLDPDGTAFKDWQVYAFPTTFVINRGQRIRYAVFGAFEWDGPEVLDALEPLLNE